MCFNYIIGCFMFMLYKMVLLFVNSNLKDSKRFVNSMLHSTLIAYQITYYPSSCESILIIQKANICYCLKLWMWVYFKQSLFISQVTDPIFQISNSHAISFGVDVGVGVCVCVWWVWWFWLVRNGVDPDWHKKWIPLRN